LAKLYPDAHVELDHRNPYELVVATILSAQSTDKMINTITPALFARYPTPGALAAANEAEVEPMIFKSGFYRNKAKSILGMARRVVEKHGGNVPRTMEELVELPGVARKTANVVLGSAMKLNVGVVVDTHVMRLSQRLGLTTGDDPVEIEQELMALLPQDQWTDFAHRMIWHGRRVCFAKAPQCDQCSLAPICPSAFAVGAPPKAAVKAAPKKVTKPTKIAKQKPVPPKARRRGKVSA
jgi:endonuclease-3